MQESKRFITKVVTLDEIAEKLPVYQVPLKKQQNCLLGVFVWLYGPDNPVLSAVSLPNHTFTGRA